MKEVVKLKTTITLCIVLFALIVATANAQCKNEYPGTNTGLACEISSDGKGRITLEDDEGDSTTLNAKKAKRTLRREERRIRRLRNQTVDLLKQTRRLNPNQSVEDSKVSGALSLVSVLAGTLTNSETQIRGRDTIKEARGALKAFRSDANRAIRQNKKTKRLLKECKRSQCDCNTKTVSASMDFYQGNDPEAPRNCKAFGLAKWSAEDTKNAKSLVVFYSWTGSGASLRSKTAISPYDDTYPFYDQEILAGKEAHQIEIVKGSKSNGNPNIKADCSDMSAEQQQLVINPYLEAEICLVVKKKK